MSPFAVNSLTLLELLRRRRALPVEETWRLLDKLPALLDDADKQGDLPSEGMLSAVEVVFANGAPGDCVGRLVSDWPPFYLHLLADATQAETAAMVDPLETRFSHDVSARFAALLYEVLGGPHRRDGARPPLAALNDAANRTLQRALAGGAFANCTEFWREFLRESADPQRAVRIPPWLLKCEGTGEVLRLTPHDGGIPIQLVARRQFRIGRSLVQADLLTRFHPETPQNEQRTKELGRVHVFGEIIDGEPTLRDGNGRDPSANGSTFADCPLAADAPTPVRRRGMLALGEHYAFEVIPHLGASGDFVIENVAEWSGPRADGRVPGPRGAIVFGLPAGQLWLRNAAWLFTRLDFTLHDGSLAWLPPARNNPAAFLRLDGCFWIVNVGLSADLLQIDERTLAPGEAAPLGTRVSVRLGTREFRRELE